MKQILHSANAKKAVVINANENAGPFWANLYVNCNPLFPNSNGLGDITLMRKKGAKLETLRQWAAEVLK